MKAALYNSFQGDISIEHLPDPQPSEGGVVIRVEASGLCLSDWHGWKGHDPDINLPHVPGHELAGTIVAVGKQVKKFEKGQRVTVPFVGGCGSCEYCLEGNQQVCNRQFQPGFTAWGSFAQYVAIDYADVNLVVLPENIDSVSAAALGCRFITAYRAVHAQGRLLPGQTLAVHGCGGVGLSAIQIAKALGARVIAIDISAAKCAFAKKTGADLVIDASRTKVVEAVRDYSQGGVHLSIDAIGHGETCLNSILGLRKRGKHIQVGLMTEEHSSIPMPMPLIIANELEILGSHGMQAYRYTEMFSFIEKSGLQLNAMVGELVGLEEVPEILPNLDTRSGAGISVIDSFE
jgi:alcohol dehydrogenase